MYQRLFHPSGYQSRCVLDVVVQPIGFLCPVNQLRRIDVRLPAELQCSGNMLQLLLGRETAVRNGRTKFFNNQHPLLWVCADQFGVATAFCSL